MPTSGYYTSFSQEIPFYSDQPHIKNGFATSHYKEINEDIVGALKFRAASVNGIGDDDVKISQRLYLGSRQLRGFEAGKVGPKDGSDYVGGNYSTSLNLEANFPNFFPEKSFIPFLSNESILSVTTLALPFRITLNKSPSGATQNL